jgi:predicted neuraminidase
MKIICHEHIYEKIVAPSCHASTVLKLKDGTLLAAWFAGEKEGTPDVTVWYSRKVGGAWEAPRPAVPNVGVQCWNPVLFQWNENTVWLFYKFGASIRNWKTMLISSTDSGKTWSEPRELIEGEASGGRGPVKNKAIRTKSGKILAPGSTEQGPWRCFIDVFDGQSWSKKDIPAPTEPGPGINLEIEPLWSMPAGVNMIQPSLWESEDGHIHALMRTNQSSIFRSDSYNDGESWSTAYPTNMPNNNSGLDCVRADDGNVYLVCNPVAAQWGDRTPLTLFVSKDNGANFEKLIDLETEKGEYSYPAIISEGNRLYITYTWKRERIAFAEIDCDEA